jgi:hypothetical protein
MGDDDTPVIMDFGSAAKAKVEIKGASDARRLQVRKMKNKLVITGCNVVIVRKKWLLGKSVIENIDARWQSGKG